MKSICCFALPFEAEPWLSINKPQLLFSLKKMRYYETKNQGFLITGMGGIQMALGIAWIAQKFDEPIHFVNIGFAASANHDLFTWHEIVQVAQLKNNKIFLPEILWHTPFIKSKIVSTDYLVNQDFLKSHDDLLVDMEAYAFMKAATHFVPITQVHLFKFISDKGIDTLEHLEILKEKYTTNLHQATAYLDELNHKMNMLKNQDEHLIYWENSILKTLPFTFTQKKFLQQKIRYAYFYQAEEKLKECLKMNHQQVKSKAQLNSLYHQLITILSDV